MSNVFSPNGFQPVKRIDSGVWNDAQREGLIAAANTHQFFKGDPIIALASGYIDRRTTNDRAPTGSRPERCGQT